MSVPGPGRLGAVAVLLALAATAGADLPEIRRRGTLRVLVVGNPGDPAVPPSRFLARHGDAVTGLEGEMLLGFARLHGLQLELMFLTSWDHLVPSLLAGKGDLIGGGFSDTPVRRRSVAFSVETFPSRSVVITRRPNPPVETLEQLRRQRVGVARGSSYAEHLRAAGVPPDRIVDTLNASAFPGQGGPASTARGALQAGRVTAIVEGVELALVGDAEELQLGMFLGPRESLAFAVRLEDVQLRAALDDYVSNVRKTATWNRLVVTYFGDKALDILKRVRDP